MLSPVLLRESGKGEDLLGVGLGKDRPHKGGHDTVTTSCPKTSRRPSLFTPTAIRQATLTMCPASRRCRCHASVEVADVTASLLDVTRRAVGIKHAMSSHDRFRMEGLDSIQRLKPLVPGLFVAFRLIFCAGRNDQPLAVWY